MRSAGARATSERRSESWAMKRQAGPREPESRGAWGPGEKPSIGGAWREAVHGTGIGWVGWDFLPEVARRGRVKGRRRGAEEGLRNTGDPGDVEERPWVEEAARSGSDELRERANGSLWLFLKCLVSVGCR